MNRCETRHLRIAGRPRLLLGGQLHNSTSSDLSSAREAFDRVVALGGNAVTATVSWHLVEPSEGRFDFAGVDALIDLARERDLALTLLWFGAWKNAASTYAPRWVRADTARFPRAELETDGAGGAAFTRPGTPVLSVFSPELLSADRRAFTALARHIADVDDAGVVVMIQVENETGLLGAARDHCVGAEAAWAAPVPGQLLGWLAEHPDATGTAARLWREQGRPSAGTWPEVFGSDEWAQEVFMAWAIASHCEALAASASQHLDVPYYANAWLGPQPGQELPGQYPSGGPTAGVLDVWQAAAPSLALLGPDIYIDDVKGTTAAYARPDNPLLIPESRLAVGNLFWTVGSGAIGFNVFGVDDVRPDGQFSSAYHLLGGAEDVIIAAQREGRIRPVLLEAGESAVVELGGLSWTVRDAGAALRQMFLDAGVRVRTDADAGGEESDASALVPSPADTRAMGILIDLGDDEILAIGQGLMFDVAGQVGEIVEIDDAVEGCYEAGEWVSGRHLNGDERLSLLPLDRLAAVRIKVLRRHV
ncbi:DUF5597 domain-containing protein [Actinomyces sp. MRS3W]|uniref:DUF5597 domain-containing protein n=1 Tax=Actinomyces sp. MRS3W TaxID=2800796 RepID=UPI0028FD4620|nr:DUF5597 domain-containing protein [Actinomyces sp. MRS3W]MDU0347967.1 DUF5597 domain-containing protein [Actinomyces sp. MRS3W]